MPSQRQQEAARPDDAAPQLTAIILTLNEAEHIQDCVRSLLWADRVVVFDSFSQDATLDLAVAAGADVLQSHFENYAQQRNAALDAIDADWVFFVDADERATLPLAEEIQRVVGERPEAGWLVPRDNYIFGRLTRGAGWYPDYQLRLLQAGKVRYERPVHETAVVDGATGKLQNALVHYNYRDIVQFHAKQKAYSSYDAQLMLEDGQRPRVHQTFLQPWRQFWWRFVELKAYRDGFHGLRLSLLLAYYEWVKYRKLAGLWRQNENQKTIAP